MHAVMIVIPITYRVVAVVVADMKAVSKIDYICHAFTCDAIHCIAGKTKGEMLYNLFWHHYFRCNLHCRSWSRNRCRRRICFRRSIGKRCFGHCAEAGHHE